VKDSNQKQKSDLHKICNSALVVPYVKGSGTLLFVWIQKTLKEHMEENVIGVFKERRYHLYLQIFPKYVTVKWGEYIQGNFTIYLSSSSTFFQASAFAYCQRQHTGPDRLLV